MTKRTSTIYGAVRNLNTPDKEELHWGPATIEEVIADLQTLSGTKYGVDWDFGDVGLMDGNTAGEVDGERVCFYGRNMVKKILKAFPHKQIA